MSDRLSIAYAGGGCRSFWGLGVLEVLGPDLPHIHEWAGVSAGAAMCLVITSGRYAQTLEYFLDATGRNKRNVYPWRVLGQSRVFPHRAMYGGAVLHALREGGFERVRSSPPVRFLMAHLDPRRSQIRSSLGAILDFLERERDDRVHGPSKPCDGICEETRTAQNAVDAEELVEWVLLSSAMPGMIGAPRLNGHRYVDAALVDNVPVRALSDEARKGSVLVVLSRPFPSVRLPNSEHRLYLAPSEPIPIHEWDYTNPQKLLLTIDLGRRDGERLRPTVRAWLRRRMDTPAATPAVAAPMGLARS